MRPELQLAMRRALALGPDHCPPDLFAGDVPAIVSGLKAHCATIEEARHSALEQTYPRTRALIGAGRFQALAEQFLAVRDVLRLPLDELGRSFPGMLSGAPSFLARVEWAWLESYRAPEAPALALADLATLEPHAIAGSRVARHPAARLVVADDGSEAIDFDGAPLRAAALVTRPEVEVLASQAGEAVAGLFRLLDAPTALGELLEQDFDGTAFLLRAGAIAPAVEQNP